MPKGNIGDWSEFYTFVKLLADGKIYAADTNLNKKENLFYLILKIIRANIKDDFTYLRNTKVKILNAKNEIITELDLKVLEDFSTFIFSEMTKKREVNGPFEIDKAAEIFEALRTNSISDNKKDKSDIRIVIHDPISQYEPLAGFSIKSYVGSKPTLFNASKSTNIYFKLSRALSSREIKSINDTGNYTNRLNTIIEKGYNLSFSHVANETFKTNLELIDSNLPAILAQMVLYKYTNRISGVKSLVAELERLNPCHYNLEINKNFYVYKINRFLVDIALGMQARKVWTGIFDATGGYIAVKPDGSLLCFHIFNWNEFQQYLLDNTKLDAPDSSPNRCDYGYLFNETRERRETTFMKLNFQIRFK